jgi:hypothetical protein
MKISELISTLSVLKGAFGDLDVYCTRQTCKITPTSYERNRELIALDKDKSIAIQLKDPQNGDATLIMSIA